MRKLLVILVIAGCGGGTSGGDDGNFAFADLAGGDQGMATDDLAMPVADLASSPDLAQQAGMCVSDAGAFPMYDRGCGGNVNCVIGYHEVDCCGTLRATGFNHAFRTAFDTAEAAWRMGCGMCNCPPGPTLCDDGKTAMGMQGVTVTCDNGMCQTHCM
jgi:hypothetical protein